MECGFGAPRLRRAHHDVEDREQLSHAGDQRELLRLARGDQGDVEGADHHVALRRHERRHVEHCAYRGAPALYKTTATHGARVATEWGDADEFRDLAPREAPELRQIRQQGAREHRPHTGYALEQLITLTPHRTRLDHRTEIRVRH